MEPDQRLKFTVFFCQQLDPNQDINRRDLEREFGSSIRFHPMPCSGRVEALHLLKAMEEEADRVIVLTCPHGRCRYREGNLRAQKRLEYAQGLLEEVGLEAERLKLVAANAQSPRRIQELLGPILAEPWPLGPSPLRKDNGSRTKSGGANP